MTLEEALAELQKLRSEARPAPEPGVFSTEISAVILTDTEMEALDYAIAALEALRTVGVGGNGAA